MSAQAVDTMPAPRCTLPCVLGVCLFAGLLLLGNRLLADPDTYWQIKVGQQILDTGALPRTDTFSFTMQGQPWISTQWLAQVLYAAAFARAGWAGPVVLTAASIAGAFAILAWFIRRRLDAVPALVLVMAALAIASPHFLVRPHALAMPVMVAWLAGLIAAADRSNAPSYWLLPLIALWANLHGSFILGLALIGPVALDVVLKVDAQARARMLLRWFVFGVAALAASCLTPYGVEAILAARNILTLGAALPLITEWRPADFSRLGAFEVCLLLGLGAVLLKGLTLPLMRIVLVIGLLHMALSHIRNITVLALLLPLVIAAPLAARFGRVDESPKAARWCGPLAAAALVAIAAMSAFVIAINCYAPSSSLAPAVAALKERGVTRVLNDYDFGGYLIWTGIPVAIDGRTELYGERFMVEVDDAMMLKNPDALFRLLASQRIDATLLRRQTPAAQLLDHVDGWKKVFTDDNAVAHVRDPSARHSAEPEIKPASN
ncbi:hypothetical protein [Afipia clevelandensis]|uniref:Glycosyltransferase RgtA/B/C/D-like domain-containing protein n=1 Tax=Afipia clevelandensis ATCC 49720 TaxID=883079 RepID=K8PBZ8_9BRAD|nr:hypothetical protein [Afipia clevelandensis]EKS35853.1 hypothetical protein HMPREF9696_02065 [Afipia clevelandensis ATCC 49720]